MTTRARIAAALVAADTLAALSACGTSVLNLEIGQCISSTSDEETVSTVPVVDCGEPHIGEIYALPQLADGEYPGAQAVGEQGEQLCAGQAFQDHVGVAYDQSDIHYSTLVPTEETWADGDREIVCILADQDDSTNTGTLRNASR